MLMQADKMAIGRRYRLVPNQAPDFVCLGRPHGTANSPNVLIRFDGLPELEFTVPGQCEVEPVKERVGG